MLNEEQKATLAAALRQRRMELLARIDEEASLEAAQEERQGRAEVGDYGDEDAGAEFMRTERSLLELHRDDLRSVDAALGRLDAGSYGRCVDCGGFIGAERLQARPAALRCEPCQELQEAAGRRPAPR